MIELIIKQTKTMFIFIPSGKFILSKSCFILFKPFKTTSELFDSNDLNNNVVYIKLEKNRIKYSNKKTPLKI
tara:strand:- start:127 stop:342 length:216 start_codon:yes stop_codon:yes gene_type:complete